MVIEKNIEKIMEYSKFEVIFNKTIFEKSKSDLVKKIAESPQRYIGLFRPTKPKAKIIQNLLQSHEIRFGDAFENLIEAYLKDLDFKILEKSFEYEKTTLKVDQIFSMDENIYFVEQKLRDDHDSSKKRGQIENFEKKIDSISKKYNGKNIIGFFYFIDTGLTKNKKYYKTELQKLSKDYGIELHLSYGKELFERLNNGEVWNEIIQHLKNWKTNIPVFPEINFDKTPKTSFEEIKNLKPLIYRKLFSNDDLDDLLIKLFPEKKTLELLSKYFGEKSKQRKIYQTLNNLCIKKIHKLKKI